MIAAPERAQTITAAPGRLSPRQAAAWLADRDAVVHRLVDMYGPPQFPRPTETPFASVVRAITFQQLAGAAARAIHGRVVALLGEVTPERLLSTSIEDLRAAGLSMNKAASLHDLATKALDGTISLDPRSLARRDDADIVARLSTVRGIGKWSAEMFLMFQLRRLDVWPTGDLGVRKGYARAWEVEVPTPKQLELLGEPYHPYRSIVAWYCWQVMSTTLPT
jgi:DNA-3-methyladenine glycosylase II